MDIIYKYIVIDDLNCKLHYVETEHELDLVIKELPHELYTVKKSHI